MKKLPAFLVAASLLSPFFLVAQKKLKKADRTIVSNIQAHTSYLNGDKLQQRKAGSDGEKMADEYIVKQFTKAGLKPKADGGWLQTFPVYDGKEILPASRLTINDSALVLYKDYFPLAFSANKNTEAAVAIALAEDGVPWFKDLREVISDSESKADTFSVIRSKAEQAAKKGASALIIYNKSGVPDLQYNRYDTSKEVSIPVLYITGAAFDRYSSDESSIIDIKLNVDLQPKSRTGSNVIGYADRGANNTIVAFANLEDETEVAALMEVARLVKSNRSHNFLFIAYSGENNGANGTNYFKEHPTVVPQKLSNTIDLDSLSATVDSPKGLNLVKRSIEIINNN
jgi:aminopeptidase YwaD